MIPEIIYFRLALCFRETLQRETFTNNSIQIFLPTLGDDAVVGNNTEAAPLNIFFPPLLIPITPIDIIIEPRFVIHHYPVIQNFPVAGAASKTPPPRSDKKGQLLTPADGCGNSALGNNRIVGGGPAKNGAWPWMALLAYKAPPQLAHLIATFNCGGSIITTRK